MPSCTHSLPTSSALVFLPSSPHQMLSSLSASPPVRSNMLGEIQLAVFLRKLWALFYVTLYWMLVLCQKTKHSKAVTVGDYSDACRAAVNICRGEAQVMVIKHGSQLWCWRLCGVVSIGVRLYFYSSIVLPALASVSVNVTSGKKTFYHDTHNAHGASIMMLFNGCFYKIKHVLYFSVHWYTWYTWYTVHVFWSSVFCYSGNIKWKWSKLHVQDSSWTFNNWRGWTS